jgi:hypothetical protein
MAGIKYSMFQSMISVPTVDLREVWRLCLDQGFEVYACVPGSLKQRIEYGSMFQVGSIHIKKKDPNLSILLFANGKLKCSGSYKLFENDHNIEDFIIGMLDPVCKLVNIVFERSSIRICLLNAGYVLSTMDESLYFKICKLIKEYYEMVVLPKSMTNTRARGRFCALKVYVMGKYPGPSLQFDHKGYIQAFAFVSVDDITVEIQKLSDIIKLINNYEY